MVTILETSISMKLSEAILMIRGKKKLEVLGLAISNFIAGIFGVLPLSLPIGRNLLALRSGASSRVYLLIACVLSILFGWIIWPWMKFLPLITVSVFNASLGVLLIDSQVFYNYWKFNPKYAIIFTLIILSCFFVDLVFCMILSWMFFLALYMQMPNSEAYALASLEQFQTQVESFSLSISKNLNNTKLNLGYSEQSGFSQEEEEQQKLVEDEGKKSDEVKELVEKIKNDGVLYELKGRFNFLFYRTHVANLRHLDKKYVVVDFSYIFGDDIEFIQEYCSFINKLEQEKFEFYVTGIPMKRVMKDVFLRGTWVLEYYKKGRLIFLN